MLARGIVLQPEFSIDLEPGVVTLYDQSRYHNDGTMNNITWLQIPGGAWVMVFNGTSSYINFGADPSLTITEATIEWWLYRPNRDNNMYLFNRVGDTNDPRIYWTVGSDIVNVNAPVGAVYVDGVATINASEQAWHHIVISGKDITNVVGNLYFGAQQTLGAGFFFEGYLGYYRIYSYALTHGQIINNYEKTKHWFGVHD